MAISKFHSRIQLFELPPLYPASSPEFPLDPDFPDMVNLLCMLQYLSFNTNLPISSLYLAQLMSEGSQGFVHVTLLKPMRRFHICTQCGDHNIFLLLWHIYFVMAEKSLLGKNTRMRILKIFVDAQRSFRLKCAKANGYKPKSERIDCFVISGPACPLM